MLIFENNEKAIYNFNLSIREEANILSQFIDDKNDLLFLYFECNFIPFLQIPPNVAYFLKIDIK